MDQILAEIAKPLAKKTWNEIMIAKRLDSEIKALEETKTSVEAALADAYSLGSCSRAQKLTLDRLARERERIVDFFDERATRAEQTKLNRGGFRSEVRLFFSSSNQLVSRFKDAHKVKHFRRELDLIVNNHAQFGTLVDMVSENKMIQSPTGPFPNTDVIIGRDEARNDLIAKLCNSSNDQESESLSIVTMVGIGGQGKTTLAQYVFNDQRVIDCFDVRLWVFATPDIRLEELLKKILAHAMDDMSSIHAMSSIHEMSQLQCRIVEAIGKKKFLLVLDNMWDHGKLKENWEQLRLLLKYGASGSKVLVTTRCKEVARIIGSPDAYMLNDLTTEYAWPLFQHFAFTSQLDPRVEAIGEEIFRMCPKTPLVLKVIGQHLREQCHTIDNWRAFKDDLAGKSSFKGNDMIMGTLKLTYDRLDEKLKPCVLYCSLFPKGMVYDVDMMVRIWIALGYIESEYKSLEDVGQDYVHMLANRGFFEYVIDEDEIGNIKKFKMHDIIHDLLVSESESHYKMVDSKTTVIDKNVCHVSFYRLGNNIYEFDWDASSSVSNIKQRLQSILMADYQCVIFYTFRFRCGYDELIARFQSLKVLDVHGMKIERIPRSLDKLIHLRYLDLSRNDMQELPNSITKLVNLLSLDLSYCRDLQELPKDIFKLSKLRHLRLYWCFSLTYMPKGLGKLKDLQTLDWFIVGQRKGNVIGGLEELSDLKSLRGGLSIIVHVESKYIVSQGRTAPLGRKDNLTDLHVEFRKSGEEDELVLECLRPQGEKLRRMKIAGYGGKKLPSWMLNDQLHCELPNLIDIWMTTYQHSYAAGSARNFVAEPELEYRPLLSIRLQNDDQLLESIPGFSELKGKLTMTNRQVTFRLPKGQRSRGLNLWGLSIDGRFATTQSLEQQQPRIFFNTWFPNLKILTIRCIAELQVLPEEFRDLSCLEELRFYACPKLKALPDWIDTLASLKSIDLMSCPAIETLPHQISNLSQLVSLSISDSSKAFVERCRKPTGELWPFIQHVDFINIRTEFDASEENEANTFTYSKNELRSRRPDEVELSTIFLFPFRPRL